MAPLLAVLVAICATGAAGGRAPPAGETPPPGTPQAAVQRIERVVVRGRGFDEPRLLEELTLRLAGRTVIAAGGGEAPPGDAATVDLSGPDPVEVHVTTPDGLHYARTVRPGPGEEPERLAAMTAAHVLVGIEEGREAPVPHPGEPAPPAERPSAPAPSGATEPLPAPAPPPGPEPLRVGVAAAAGTVLPPGLSAGVDVYAGSGGALALTVLAPTGLSARFAVRLSGRRISGGAGLLRVRVGAGAGYARPVGRLVVGVGAFLFAEPLVTLDGGRAVRPKRDGRPARPVLLGGALRLSATWVAGVFGRARLRMGPFVELGGAFSPGGGRAHVPVFEASGGSGPRVRAGAFEFASGLAAVLEWGVARRPRRR